MSKENKLTVKKTETLNFYQGPGAIEGIKFKSAGSDLGVKSWGMNLLEMSPDCISYPEHNHIKDGQEEVYLVLKGDGLIIVDGVETRIFIGDFLKVVAEANRKIVSGKNGITFLALGGTPGVAYPAILELD